MKSFWKILKGLSRYKKYFVLAGGALLAVLKFLEGIFQYWKKTKEMNEAPSGRPPVGTSDGVFTQPHTSPAKKPKVIPQGTTPEIGLKIEGEGEVAPKVSSSTEPPTGGVIEQTKEFLGE